MMIMAKIIKLMIMGRRRKKIGANKCRIGMKIRMMIRRRNRMSSSEPAFYDLSGWWKSLVMAQLNGSGVLILCRIQLTLSYGTPPFKE